MEIKQFIVSDPVTKLCDEYFFDAAITNAEDEQTASVKSNNKYIVYGCDLPHARKKVGIIKQGKNVGWTVSTHLNQAVSMICATKGDRIASKVQIATYQDQ